MEKQMFRPCDGSKHGVFVFDSPVDLEHSLVKTNLTLTSLDEQETERQSPRELDKVRGCKIAYDFTIKTHLQTDAMPMDVEL